jgi:hypothetical protein
VGSLRASLCVWVVACYHPMVQSDVPCAANGACPGGELCDTTQSPPTCVSQLADAARLADAPIGTTDAALDAPPDAPTTDGILFRQKITSKPTGSIISITLPDPVQAGDTIINCLNFPNAGSGSAASFVAATDTLNSTAMFTLGPYGANGAIHGCGGLYATNEGSDTITVAFSASIGSGGTDWLVVVYGGLAGTGSYDTHAENSGTGAAMDSGEHLTTKYAHQLVLGYAEAGAATPGSGFTERAMQSGNILEDRIVSVTGNYDADATNTSGGGWAMMMLSFEAAMQ